MIKHVARGFDFHHLHHFYYVKISPPPYIDMKTKTIIFVDIYNVVEYGCYMNTEIPRLDSGEIDFDKVDPDNDFRLFPPLYTTPDDIEKHILDRELPCPTILNVLRLRRETKLLGFSPIESEVYFEEFFKYIYDVYRIPTEETYEKVDRWLIDYLEGKLVMRGVKVLVEQYYETIDTSRSICDLRIQIGGDTRPVVNCYHDIEVNHKEYYNARNTDALLEQFWIETSDLGQPENVGDRNFMRVHVYSDRVYIFGCDDSSYTNVTNDVDVSKKIAENLKKNSPVWCMAHLDAVYEGFEFTN